MSAANIAAKLWDAFAAFDDDDRREQVDDYLRVCDELQELCKTHKVSDTMSAALIRHSFGCVYDVPASTIKALRRRGLIGDDHMRTDLGQRIGTLAQKRMTARSVMRQDMLTEVP